MNLTILAAFIFIQAPTDLYNQGNAAYAAKDYSQAIALYEQARRSVQDPRVLYNLGNAYFKTNKIGRAIQCFRQARRLSPRDPDIEFNLNFARNFRVDKTLVLENPFTRLAGRVLRYFSGLEASLLAAFFFLCAAACLCWFVINRRRLWLWLAMPLAMTFLFFFCADRVWRAESDPASAVIIVPEANALSGPGDDFSGIMVIHDGTEARVRETRGDYCLIQLPGGLGGWVKSNTLEPVFPRPR